MRKALTLVALALACVAATSVAYYFGWYLPHAHDADIAEKRRQSEQKAARCDADGKEFYSEFIETHPMSMPGWEIAWGQPETHYSGKTDSCMVDIPAVHRVAGPPRLRSQTLSIYRNQVSDVYRARVVLYGWFERKPDGGETLIEPPQPGIPNYTSEQYLREKRKLFSE
jgi:hypothetical protein